MEALAGIPLIGSLFGGGGAAAGAAATGADLVGSAIPELAVSGAGAAAGSSIWPTLMKAAPLVMGAGSLLTKDKTMKDLLGIGSLVAGGANLLGGFGGATGAAPGGGGADATGPMTGIGTGGSPYTIPAKPAAPPPATPVATNATNASRYSDIWPAVGAASQVGQLVGGQKQQQNPFQIPPPGQNVPFQAVPQVQKPVIGAPSFTPGANSPATHQAYQRWLQMTQGMGA